KVGKTEIAMKKWMLCLLGFLSLGSVAWSQAKPAGGGVEKAIGALEDQWLQAAKTQSPDLIAASYDDRLVDTDSTGKVSTKAQGMAYLKATKFTAAGSGDAQVRVLGNTPSAGGA